MGSPSQIPLFPPPDYLSYPSRHSNSGQKPKQHPVSSVATRAIASSPGVFRNFLQVPEKAQNFALAINHPLKGLGISLSTQEADRLTREFRTVPSTPGRSKQDLRKTRDHLIAENQVLTSNIEVAKNFLLNETIRRDHLTEFNGELLSKALQAPQESQQVQALDLASYRQPAIQEDEASGDLSERLFIADMKALKIVRSGYLEQALSALEEQLGQGAIAPPRQEITSPIREQRMIQSFTNRVSGLAAERKVNQVKEACLSRCIASLSPSSVRLIGSEGQVYWSHPPVLSQEALGPRWLHKQGNEADDASSLAYSDSLISEASVFAASPHGSVGNKWEAEAVFSIPITGFPELKVEVKPIQSLAELLAADRSPDSSAARSASSGKYRVSTGFPQAQKAPPRQLPPRRPASRSAPLPAQVPLGNAAVRTIKLSHTLIQVKGVEAFLRRRGVTTGQGGQAPRPRSAPPPWRS